MSGSNSLQGRALLLMVVMFVLYSCSDARRITQARALRSEQMLLATARWSLSEYPRLKSINDARDKGLWSTDTWTIMRKNVPDRRQRKTLRYCRIREIDVHPLPVCGLGQDSIVRFGRVDSHPGVLTSKVEYLYFDVTTQSQHMRVVPDTCKSIFEKIGTRMAYCRGPVPFM